MPKRAREPSPDEDLNDPKKKIFDGTYYELVDWDGKSLKIKGKCRNCDKELSGQYTSTGNYL